MVFHVGVVEVEVTEVEVVPRVNVGVALLPVTPSKK